MFGGDFVGVDYWSYPEFGGIIPVSTLGLEGEKPGKVCSAINHRATLTKPPKAG